MNDAAEVSVSSGDIAPGRLLARLRAERKLTVADVAQRLKYAVRQIEALEAEEFSRLPGTTFVRGMVRGYAKLLEIDPEPLLRSLERRQIPGAATVDLRAKRVPFPDGTRRHGTRIYAVMSALVLIAVGGVVYEWHTGGLPALPRSAPAEVAQPSAPDAPAEAPITRVQGAPEKPAAAPSREMPKATVSLAKPAPAPKAAAEPVKAAPAAPKPVPESARTAGPAPVAKDVKSVPGPNRIFMEFADDAWVEISDGEGKTLMAQLNHGGSRRVVFGHPPFSVVIGNAASVRIVYNDRPVDLVPYVKVEVARFTLP
jgi:cytoskeleton protein RodZ